MSTNPPPTVNDQPFVVDRAIAEVSAQLGTRAAPLVALLRERDAKGRATYGTPLQPFNGRDAMQDTAEEGGDMTAYLMQAVMEHPGHPARERLRRLLFRTMELTAEVLEMQRELRGVGVGANE